ncbi:AAA family ATPase [Chloroflexota bacterium]
MTELNDNTEVTRPITNREDARELSAEEQLSPIDLDIYEKVIEKARLLPRQTEEDCMNYKLVINAIAENCGIGSKQLIDIAQWLNNKLPNNPILIPSHYATTLNIIELPDWLIPGLALRNGLTLFYGEAGSYKTILTIYMGYALMTGTDFLGIPVEGNYKVLYVEQDESHSVLKEQVQMIGYPEEMFICCKLPVLWNTRQFNQEFFDTLKALQPDIVFIDAYTSLGIEDITRPQSALCLDALRRIASEYKISIIITHHENKAGTQMGSALHIAKIDSEVQTSITSRDGNRETIILTQGKVRGQHIDPVYIEAQKDTLRLERRLNMNLTQMIRIMLTEGQDRATILSNFRGTPRNSARRILSRIINERNRTN